MNLEHLDKYETYWHGPIQQDEALFLYSLVKMIHPSLILEFGVQYGYSTWNFALAKDEDCKLFSYDIDLNCLNNVRKLFIGIKNFSFIHKNCLDFTFSDIDNQLIDLCFIDCAHILSINQQLIDKILPFMSKNAIIAIHDTGTHTRKAINKKPEGYENKLFDNPFVKEVCLVEERQTVNWFAEKYPEYSLINLHSENFFRHGITIFQKKSILATDFSVKIF